jgi:hypothetical protein
MENNRVSSEHWTLQNFFIEAKRLKRINKWKILPEKQVLAKKHCGYVATITRIYEGRFPKLREDLGYNETNQKNLIKELKAIVGGISI